MAAPSFAVVVFDTLRKDAFDRYFEWIPGRRFQNAYSTSHWTIPAHASLLTGRYPSELGIHGKSRSFDCPDPSIVERLHESGYTTRMWSANPQLNFAEGWDRGFDHYVRSQNLDPRFSNAVDWQAYLDDSETTGTRRYLERIKHAVVGPKDTVPSLMSGFRQFRRGKSTEDTTRAIRDRLKKTEFGDREFLFVNLMTTHTPHYPPKPFRTTTEKVGFTIGDGFAGTIDDPDRNRRAYDDSAAYLAWMYRRIFTELTETFDYVITLSDHGELLGEYGLWNHGYGLYPELVHVPLVISGDGIESSDRTNVASLLDVPRTIADLANVDLDSRGQNLLDDTKPCDRLVESHGFLSWHREQFERKGVGELYDKLDSPLRGLVTASGRYFYQTHDSEICSSTTHLEIDDPSRLQSLVGRIPDRDVDESGTDDDVSDRTKQRLRDLGYA